jgi:hypothetical protein
MPKKCLAQDSFGDKMFDVFEDIRDKATGLIATEKDYKNVPDRNHMVKIVDEDRIISVSFRSKYNSIYKSSLSYLIKKESGGVFVPGTSQGMTYLLHHLKGMRSRSNTVEPVDGQTAKQVYYDSSALAPTNVTIPRLLTFYESSTKSRVGLRFRVGLKLDVEWFGDNNLTENLQLASMLCTPKPIIDDETHRRYWLNWDSDAMHYTGQKSWSEVGMYVTFDTIAGAHTEYWVL